LFALPISVFTLGALCSLQGTARGLSDAIWHCYSAGTLDVSALWHSRELRIDPLRLIVKTNLSAKFAKMGISGYRIEADTPIKLSQIHGTQMRWTCIAFGEMIRAVHDAPEVDAVGNSEHVSRLMCQHLAASPKY